MRRFTGSAGNWILGCALLVSFLSLASTAGAATPKVSDLTAWPWGTTRQQLQKDFPADAAVSSEMIHVYRGKLVLMGTTLQEASVYFTFDAERGMQSVRILVSPEHWRSLVSRLERQHGKPRYASTPDQRAFTHFLEWSTPRFGVTASITTTGEHPGSDSYQQRKGSFQILGGPISRSAVDSIEQARAAAGKASRQSSASKQPAAPDSESDAIRWAHEYGERLRTADCNTPSSREFQSFERIFKVPGDKATKTLLDEGFDAHQYYYDGGFPARCERPQQFARPLIHAAVRADNVAAVRLLARRGANVEFVHDGSICLLLQAARQSSPEVLRALLETGARCEGVQDGRRMVFGAALSAKGADKLQALLDNGFKLDQHDLHSVASRNDLAKVRLLCKHGYKWTGPAARQAALYSSPDVLEVMVRSGTDATELFRTVVTPSFSFGSEPMDSERTERARRLLDLGAQVATGGKLYPEVAGAIVEGPQPLRELLASEAERAVPGSSETSRKAFRKGSGNSVEALAPATPPDRRGQLVHFRTVPIQPPIRSLNEYITLHDSHVTITRADFPDNASPVIVEIPTGRAARAPYLKGDAKLEGLNSRYWIVGHRQSSKLEIVDRSSGRIVTARDLSKHFREWASTSWQRRPWLQFATTPGEVWIAENRMPAGTMVTRFSLPGLDVLGSKLLPVNGRVVTWDDKLVIAGCPAGLGSLDKLVVGVFSPSLDELSKISLPDAAPERSGMSIHVCDNSFTDVERSLLVFATRSNVAYVVDLRTRKLVKTIDGAIDAPEIHDTDYSLYRGKLLRLRLLPARTATGYRGELTVLSLEPQGKSFAIQLNDATFQLSRAGLGVHRWDRKLGATTAFDIFEIAGIP